MSPVPHGSTPKTRPTESGPAAADRRLLADEPDNAAATDPCGATASFDDPNAARVWNYFAGGSLNSSVDRELARRLAAVFPAHPLTQAGWDFQRRVITDLLARGIRQFLDLGSGLLSHHGVRELAEAFGAEVRVVYLDVDPVVIHATTIHLTGTTGTVAIRADLRDPTTVLAHPDLRAVLDVELPVAVLAFSVLDTLADTDHPGDHVTTLAHAFAAGSYLAISHLTADTASPDLCAQLDTAIALFADTGTTIVPRDAATLASWLSGLDVLDPGVCLAALWRPDHPVSPEPHQQLLLGAVARTPTRTDHPAAAPDSEHRVTEPRPTNRT